MSVHYSITALLAVALSVCAPSLPLAQDNQLKSATSIDRNVVFRNRSGKTMVAFHSSNAQALRWGTDLLASNPVPNGRSFKLNFDNKSGYCLFDVRATFADGHFIVVEDLDVCEIGTFTFEP